MAVAGIGKTPDAGAAEDGRKPALRRTGLG
jgi:hypothetical protein